MADPGLAPAAVPAASVPPADVLAAETPAPAEPAVRTEAREQAEPVIARSQPASAESPQAVVPQPAWAHAGEAPAPSAGEPVPAAAQPAAPAPAAEERGSQPIVVPRQSGASRDALAAMVNAAGMQWVETDPERLQQARERMAQDSAPVQLGREPRIQPPVSNEPLQQVETRR